LQRLQAAAVDENLSRHIKALTYAIRENDTLLAETMQRAEVEKHLQGMRREAATAVEKFKSARLEAGRASAAGRPSN